METNYEQEYMALRDQYDDLQTEVNGMRMALESAKEESERSINQALEEVRVARSDLHTLEEVIVKLAMRLVGM